jgi:hypothetical protein
VRGLSAVGAAGLDRVVGTDRHIELLLPVVVHVAEQEAERPVVVFLPAFEGGPDRLAAGVALAGEVERAGGNDGDEAGDE